MSTSCCGCKFLFGDGTGYSSYTWEETYVTCALDRNALLGETQNAQRPEDWNQDPERDNWKRTRHGRCDRYAPGPYVICDPDREEHPADTEGVDDEQVAAICAVTGYRWPR